MRISSLTARLRGLGSRSPQHYDVVFYTLGIGSLVSAHQSLPPGGAETQIFRLAKLLAKRGKRVAIIVQGDRRSVPPQVDGVCLVTRRPRCTRRAIGKVVEAWRCWQSLWRVPSSPIVCRGAAVDLIFLALYARASGRRLIFSSANVSDFDGYYFIPKRSDRYLYELGVRQAETIIVQTREQARLCEVRFGRVALLIKSIADAQTLSTGPPVAFVWIGRLASYKQPLAYLELARALPEATFWMVGVPSQHLPEDGSVAQAVLDQARVLPNLTLLAPRPHAAIQELLDRAVASVNTACSEGMPNVLLEGWSRGVPALVLTHDPDGIVAQCGLGGFAAGSMERFAALAREQWNTRHSRTQLSARCQAYVKSHHSSEVVASQWSALLSTQRRAVLDVEPAVAPSQRGAALKARS